MTDLRIVNAPLALKADIRRLCLDTFQAHRLRQPFAFPQNAFDLLLGPLIDRAFTDAQGKAAAISDCLFAAYRGATFCGYVLLSNPNAFDPPPPALMIYDIHVLHAFRGTGVGRALLAHVKSLADQQGCDNLQATVWQGNDAALNLFRAAGFTPQSQTLRYGLDRQARDISLPKLRRRPILTSMTCGSPSGWPLCIWRCGF